VQPAWAASAREARGKWVGGGGRKEGDRGSEVRAPGRVERDEEVCVRSVGRWVWVSPAARGAVDMRDDAVLWGILTD
jgi:hypothetical protein